MNREDVVFHARMAEQTKRYEEMFDWMKQIAHLNVELTKQERKLLNIAHKKVIGVRRAAWRNVIVFEKLDETQRDNHKLEMCKAYRVKIATELKGLCQDVFDLLDNHLIPFSSSSESKVNFYKLKADYYRYLSESTTGFDHGDAAENSLAAYRTAYSIAKEELPPVHVLRLGVALNFSVFFYEILHLKDSAVRLAKGAFDEAIAELDTLEEDNYAESTLLMKQIHQNLDLWTPNVKDSDDVEQKAET